jgi:2-polyprenyl-3-methyl-5-hydroxy-6-metoxy-1,4-benzoquinol methylase
MFGRGFARRMARRYRRRGLDGTAERMVDFLAGGSLEGATVLEVGGGVGEIHVELLRRGARSATSLELSTAYDEEARRLAERAGVADRVTRQVVDIAASPDQVPAADLVVLHRVVCCYPDYERLLGAAADHCHARLAFSHPPRNPLIRSVVATQNALLTVWGKRFRTFAHPPEAMREVVTSHGLTSVFTHRGRIWQVEALTR